MTETTAPANGADEAALLARLAELDLANVSDALQGLGILNPAIRAIVPGVRLVGPAFTAKCYPGSIITVHKALLEAPPGAVLVVDGEGDERGALFGELMAQQARQNGVAGIVVDGVIRDPQALLDDRFPTFARGLTPRVGTNRRVGATQIPIQCGGVIVRPGDYILADDSGVLVVPSERLAAIVEATEAIARKEETFRQAIAEGRQIADLTGLRTLIGESNAIH